MFTDFLHGLLQWIEMHPHWAYVAVFLTAGFESLVIVGLFLPGAVIMFGVGALIATGALDFWPSFFWSVLGAVAGDGFSFWLGRHYHQRLRVVWPFRSYPRLINRGVEFFHNHGGKSVLLARFVGPVRPILPAVAGMLNMSPVRFLFVNSLSALLWAPAYLLPGIVFGTSLGLAAEVAGRLAVLLLVLLALLWLGFWSVVRILRLLQPHATALTNRILDWSRNHPVIRPLAGSLLDPDHPEARGLAVLAALLGIAVIALGVTLTRVVQVSPITGFDRNLFEIVQGLRNPWADRFLTGITALGDPVVLLLFMLAVLAWLLWRRHWKAAAHWGAAYLSAVILTRLLKVTAQVPRPATFRDGALSTSFPSAHTSISLTLFGFFAVLVARELPLTRRWIPYTLAAMLVIPIAFSRLYLGAHWPTDILGGVTLGLVGVSLFGIGYSRHPAERLSPAGLAVVGISALAVIASWHIGAHFNEDLQRYAVHKAPITMPADVWWADGWQQLPDYRIDLRDSRSFPLDVQYAGDLETLERVLKKAGWHRPPGLSAATALLWLTPEPALDQLPVLPQVHDGAFESLRLLQHFEHEGCFCVLRLWPARLVLSDPHETLWLGLVSKLRLVRPLGLMNVLLTDRDFDMPISHLQSALAGHFELQVRQRTTASIGHNDEGVQWNGQVLLIRKGKT